MQVQVDYSRCTGLGVCESISPDVFAINADGSMELRTACPSAELRQGIEEAAASCPTEAISITD